MSLFARLFLIFSIVVTFFCHASQDPFDFEESENLAQNIPEKLDAEWKPPVFLEEKSKIGHIFREKIGHFANDTPENRRYILDAASNPANKAGVNKQGVEIYLKMMPDRLQAWACVRNGIIVNGGCNRYPQTWILDPELPMGGKTISIKYHLYQPDETEFKIRLQFNKLMEIYQSYHPKNPMKLKNVTIGFTKGVENQTGLILNMFDDFGSLYDKEHMFFMPMAEDSSLEEDEVLQMLSELATGIFFHEAVPFFSLHFNKDLIQYPIIHPAYQNTFVGRIIALLDYYMKGFINGVYFEEAFIQKWEAHPSMDETFLKSKCINLQEYCQKHLNTSYLTFEEIYEELKAELLTQPSDASMIDHELCTRSFRMIAKQESIKRAENLFLIDGTFDVFYSLDPIQAEALSSVQRQLEEKACEKMCMQIKTIMPRLPLFKKYFQALSLINFFTYYFKTLKEADKVPAFTSRVFDKKAPGCPSAFPPFPLDSSSSSRLEIAVLRLFDTLHKVDHQRVVDGIKKKPHSSKSNNEAIASLAQALYQFASSLLPPAILNRFDWNQDAADLFEVCQIVDEKFTETIDASLLVLGLKKAGEPISEKMVHLLISNIDGAIKKTYGLILEVKEKIQEHQKKNLPCHELMAELAELSKMNDEFIDDKQMWQLWSKGSLIPSLGKAVMMFDPVNNQVMIYPERFKGVPHIAGGCGIHLADKHAEHSPFGQVLLEHYESSLSTLPLENLLRVRTGQGPGALFKIALQNFSITNEEERMVSLGYYSIPYSQNRLNNANVQAFHAISTQDENLFKTAAAEIWDWDFKDPLGVSLLHYAARETNPFFLTYILDRQAALNQQVDFEITDPQGYTALHEAARHGNLSCLEKLFRKAPHLLDSLSKDGETPLYVAAQNHQLSCVRFLLQVKANPDLKTKMGMNVLLSSVYLGLEEVALELLNQSAVDLEQSLEDGATAFHLAVEAEMEKVVDRLCTLGCNARRARVDGYTPLHLAAEQGWIAGIHLILKKCPYIDLNAKSTSGKTARQIAQEHQHVEIIHLLQKHLQ
ncbi:MAG: ankyrin repeat domain-containing protein [Anaerolineae bacterium]